MTRERADPSAGTPRPGDAADEQRAGGIGPAREPTGRAPRQGDAPIEPGEHRGGAGVTSEIRGREPAGAAGPDELARLDLLDYRRRVHELYARVRDRLAAGEPEAAHAHWRDARDRLFGQHPQSALDAEQRAAFVGLSYFRYDRALAFVARLEPASEELTLALAPGTVFRRCGAVELPIGRLDVFWLEAYPGGIFVPFCDATSGASTYGGGRYLLDTAKGADLGVDRAGRLRLDFNFAYNPSCQYNPRWTCPLAPPGNRLSVPVAAGERRDDGG